MRVTPVRAITAEKDRRILLLKIGEAGIWGAVSIEGEGGRVKAGALQPFLEPPVGLRIAGQIDELLVNEVERDRALVDINERGHDLLAHEPRRVDLRFAPAGREPFLGDERENHLAAIRRLLQRVLPALAGHDAALRIEIKGELAGVLELCEAGANQKSGGLSTAGLAEQIKMVAR